MSKDWDDTVKMMQDDEGFEPPPNVWDHYAAAALAALLGRGWDVATALETAESVADEMMVRRAE